MPSQRPFIVYPVLAAGLVGFAASPILVRLAADAPGLTLAVWRTNLAVLMLLPFAVRRVGAGMRALGRSDWALIGGAGVLLGVHFVAWIESLYHTSVASASVLVTSSPIFIAVLGWAFLGERLTLREGAAIMVAAVGAVLIGVGDAADTRVPNATLGNALALAAALVVSIYLLIGRVVRQRVSWLTYVFPLYSVVAVTTLGLALLRGTPLFGFDASIYLLCGLMALGPQILGHGSFNFALRYFPAALLGLLALLEPVGASLAAYALFGEAPGPLAIAGMVTVLLAVGGALWPSRWRHATPTSTVEEGR